MAGHHPRPFLLFLLPALDKVGDPCGQTEVVRVVARLLLLVLLLALAAGVVAPDGPVDAVISGWQLRRFVSGAGPVPRVPIAGASTAAAPGNAVGILVAAPSSNHPPVVQHGEAGHLGDLGPQHLHGHHVDDQDPDGAVQYVTATGTERYQADTLTLKFSKGKVCI